MKYAPTLSLVAYSFYIGLVMLYTLDFIEFIVIMSWYFVSRTELHSLVRNLVMSDMWNEFIAVIAAIPSFIVTYIFVIRKKKYKAYYAQFDKLPDDMQSTWSYVVILLFVLGLMVTFFLGRFRAMYIPQ